MNLTEMKERLTITLDTFLLKEIDATIDGINVRNRSHAIERLLETALTQNAPKKAVVLAGGSTVRSSEGILMPKVMLKVRNKPILEYVLQELSRNGVNELVIAAGEGSEQITSYFGNGSSFGVRITYLIEEKRRGTEGALLLAKGLVGPEPFFVVNGDNMYKFDLLNMYKQHLATKAVVTIALTTAEKTSNFGVIKLEGSKIMEFTEKPVIGKSQLVSTGMYIFDKSALDMIEPSSQPSMLESGLFPRLAEIGKLYGYVISGAWQPLISNNIEGSIKKMEKLVASASF